MEGQLGELRAIFFELEFDIFTDEEVGVGKARTQDVLITVADNGVATFVRVDDGTPLAAGERVINYYKHGWQMDLGATSYFFQEGTAAAYANAKYGELRVDEGGTSILIGLRDENLQPLGQQ